MLTRTELLEDAIRQLCLSTRGEPSMDQIDEACRKAVPDPDDEEMAEAMVEVVEKLRDRIAELKFLKSRH